MPRETLHLIVKLKVELVRKVYDDGPALRADRPLELRESTLTHHVATSINREELFLRNTGRAEIIAHIVTDSVRKILGDGMIVEVLQKTAGLLAKDT